MHIVDLDGFIISKRVLGGYMFIRPIIYDDWGCINKIERLG